MECLSVLWCLANSSHFNILVSSQLSPLPFPILLKSFLQAKRKEKKREKSFQTATAAIAGKKKVSELCISCFFQRATIWQKILEKTLLRLDLVRENSVRWIILPQNQQGKKHRRGELSPESHSRGRKGSLSLGAKKELGGVCVLPTGVGGVYSTSPTNILGSPSICCTPSVKLKF